MVTFGALTLIPVVLPAAAPFNSISGVPAKPGWVVPSIVRAFVTLNPPAAPTLIVRTPAPGMLNEIVSPPAPAFTALIASRKEQSALHVPSSWSSEVVTVKFAACAVGSTNFLRFSGTNCTKTRPARTSRTEAKRENRCFLCMLILSAQLWG